MFSGCDGFEAHRIFPCFDQPDIKVGLVCFKSVGSKHIDISAVKTDRLIGDFVSPFHPKTSSFALVNAIKYMIVYILIYEFLCDRIRCNSSTFWRSDPSAVKSKSISVRRRFSLVSNNQCFMPWEAIGR